MEEVETNCGVYFIINKVNGRFYIGSSINLKKRLKRHRYELRKQLHANHRLSDDCEKYGLNSFCFVKIHFLPKGSEKMVLLLMEQLYIDHYRPQYNLIQDVFATFSRPEEDRYIIKRPDGTEVKCKNVAEFCRENRLQQSKMSECLNGNINSHNGYRIRKIDSENYAPWIDVKAYCRYDYLIIQPDGNRIEISGSKDFCEKMGICPASFHRAHKFGYVQKEGVFANYVVFKMGKGQSPDSITELEIEKRRLNGTEVLPPKKIRPKITKPLKYKYYVYRKGSFAFLGKFVSLRQLSEDLGIASQTVKSYLSKERKTSVKMIFRTSPINEPSDFDFQI